MSKSEHDVMDELCSWNDLSKEDLEMYRASPTIAETILRLYKQGFKCTEDDSLLILAVDPALLGYMQHRLVLLGGISWIRLGQTEFAIFLKEVFLFCMFPTCTSL
jgi:hypothetical protein